MKPFQLRVHGTFYSRIVKVEMNTSLEQPLWSSSREKHCTFKGLTFKGSLRNLFGRKCIEHSEIEGYSRSEQPFRSSFEQRHETCKGSVRNLFGCECRTVFSRMVKDVICTEKSGAGGCALYLRRLSHNAELFVRRTRGHLFVGRLTKF